MVYTLHLLVASQSAQVNLLSLNQIAFVHIKVPQAVEYIRCQFVLHTWHLFNAIHCQSVHALSLYQLELVHIEVAHVVDYV